MAFPKTTGSYKIKKGDTLSQIAQRRGTTVSKIMKMNPSIKDKNKIRAGAGLKLPPKPIKATAKDKQKAARGKADFKKLFPKRKTTAMSETGMGARRGTMVRAAGGKMAKGYSKGGARKMMTAMGGKMAKGYSKGGAKMLKAAPGKLANKKNQQSFVGRRAQLGAMPIGTMRSLYKALGTIPGVKPGTRKK